MFPAWTAIAVMLVIAALTGLTSGARAATSFGCNVVHAGPALPPGTPAASYVTVTLAAGSSAQSGVVVANPQPFACGVSLLAAYGKTALNSGDTYPTVSAHGACVKTSCWLSGLPVTVNVKPRERLVVPFAVTVPAGTPSGQYLAGVVASPSAPPSQPRVSGHEVGAAVVTHISIGVAVTVPGPLNTLLTIPTVTLQPTNPNATINIVERNGGNAWLHPHGDTTIMTGGRPKRFGIRSRTVLPGDSATLPLTIGDVPRGTWPTEVRLWYDHDRKVAIWRGVLSYPKPAVSAAATHGYTVRVVSSKLPSWVKALIGGLALISLLLGGFLLFLLWKRRRKKDEAQPAPQAA